MLIPRAEDVLQKARSMGFTQEDVAKIAGVSQSMISKISSGKVNPSYRIIRKLNNALEAQGSREKTAGEVMHRGVLSVKPGSEMEEVKKLMKEHDFSQIPVIDKGVVKGVVTEHDLVFKQGQKASEVMSPPPPVVQKEESITHLKDLIKDSPCALVVGEDGFLGVVTKQDLL